MAGTKRKHGEDSSNELYSNKSRAKPTAEARVDPTYGQRSAIPGLSEDENIDGYDEELNYVDHDALSYLRAVRKEATSIPNLLVAPKDPSSVDSRDIYENGIGDHRGWYEDGAYCAAPQENSQTSCGAGKIEIEVRRDPQLAYFDSILSRYEALRAQLQQTPPPEVVARLDKDRPTHLGGLNLQLARWWRWQMRETDPVPAQIASMDKSTVLRLLGLMTTGTLLKRGAEVQVGVSRWAWALLARLPERGELTSEEIGVVRQMGKKAVLVGMGLEKKQAWGESMDEVEAAFEDDDYEEEIFVTNDDEVDLGIGCGFEEDNVESPTLEANLIDADESQELQNPRQLIGPQLPTENSAVNLAAKDQKDDEILYTANGEHVDDGGELSNEDLAVAKARILKDLNKQKAEEAFEDAEIVETEEELESNYSTARWNTKATADMIITVAGEMYGQRDLLEFRQSWGQD